MSFDVVAMGELLIDFTDSGISGQGNPQFEANPGGAPCNVLAMLTRLGRKTTFIGKVGDDIFGRLLKEAVEDVGVDTRGVVMDPHANTTLAFVKNAPDGDREFSFFRNPGADTLLCESEIPAGIMEGTRIFHFGSLSLTHEPVRSATRAAVALAKKAGAWISFDPNLRPLLWSDLAEAKQQILWGCEQCDILKIGDEELSFASGAPDIEGGVAWVRQSFPQIQLLMVTKGKHGSEAYWKQLHASAPTYLQIKAIDTTGAGDTFCACCLHHVLEYGLANFTKERLEAMLCFSNAASSLVTAKKGALRSMPEYDQIRMLVDEKPHSF